jgi:hypothetical protein
MSTLAWKSDTVNGREHYSSEMLLVCFPAGVGNVTYYASWSWRRPTIKPEAKLQVVGPRGGLRFLSLGKCASIAEAKSICEQHWADGCDFSGSRHELASSGERAEALAAGATA